MRKHVLIPLILLFALFSCKKSEREILVLPKGFKGYVIVIFNQENGTPINYKDRSRVYEIPQDGVLRTQFPTNGGWGDFPIFYYGSISPENQLPQVISNETILGIKGSTGSIRKNSFSDERVWFAKYYIETKENIQRIKENAKKVDILKFEQ